MPVDFRPYGAAPVWTTYTPGVTAGTGSLTTVSAIGRYWLYGKTLHLQVEITVTTNGTGATTLNFTLPSGMLPASNQAGCGRERAVSGKQQQCLAQTGNGVVISTNYDNTYPAANGSIHDLSMVLEIQ